VSAPPASSGSQTSPDTLTFGEPGSLVGEASVRALVPTPTHDRKALLDAAVRLSAATIAWNGIVGLTSLVAAVISGSSALAAFALNALLDSAASVVLLWRFHRERVDPEAAERLERRAQTWIVVAMLGVAAYITVRASLALSSGIHPEASAFGAVVAGLSVVFLPWLGRTKARVAASLRSPALRGDALLTLAAAALAAVTLIALVLNSALGWWWADPLAALLIAAALAIEGTRVAVRHRFG